MSHLSIRRRMIPLALLGLIVLRPPIAAAAEIPFEKAKEAYIQHCARCHGAEGKGDGPDARHVYVPPRDLTSGRFKFKSTVSGTPPSDEDLMVGIIGHGLYGSGMPSFGTLNDETKHALVAYVKAISPAFQAGLSPEPIALPSNHRQKIDLKKGKEVFDKLQCALCHGPNGRANGTSATTLVDAWGHPLKPANLAEGWAYRGGSETRDIYYRIVAGIDGAPMPSYEGAATREEIWELSAYVRSLQKKTNWSDEIQAVSMKNLPTSGGDDAWKNIPHTDVNVQGYVMDKGKRVPLGIKAVSVQVAYNKDKAAFRLEWNDPVQNTAAPADALLVAFRPVDYNGDPRGNLHTLYEANDPALNMMKWDARNETMIQLKKDTLAAASSSAWSAASAETADARFDDGRWTLTFTRPLAVDGMDTLKTQGTSLMGLAAWEGASNETGLRYSASQWIRLEWEPKKSHH